MLQAVANWCVAEQESIQQTDVDGNEYARIRIRKEAHEVGNAYIRTKRLSEQP